MNVTALLFTAAAMTMSTSSGSAQTEHTKSAVQSKSRAGDPNAKVCHIEDRTGSLFTEKVCRTRAEWRIIDRDNETGREGVFKMRRGILGKMDSGQN
ncbi:MAG: hypothetical protein EOO38_23010 [Cytophagaceae bacterium]|nr:MAG: hypothetical protein EOO38_23010 [Cytophagaceae bacterium]